MIKKLIKLLSIFILSFPLFFFSNSSFSNETFWETLQAFVFAIILGVAYILPNLRKYFLYLSLILIILMAMFTIFKYLDWADIFGSSGIGILVVSLLGYMPDIIKKGYIKKL